jgi:uncharacterized membrane protein AbrB (regulator of aidB expression)
MRQLIISLAGLWWATAALAQADRPSTDEQRHAAMMILMLVILGLAAFTLLGWWLKRSGRLDMTTATGDSGETPAVGDESETTEGEH